MASHPFTAPGTVTVAGWFRGIDSKSDRSASNTLEPAYPEESRQ